MRRFLRPAGAVLAAAALLCAAGAGARGADPAKASRVTKARAARGDAVRRLVTRRGLAYPPEVVHLRVFKEEGQLEVWAGRRGHDLMLLETYRICARSGDLGPKRRDGDGQVPEGAYRVVRYNAWSNFHLSLGLDYPNASDRILGKGGRLGGDIFIHGSCVTIGCIPIQDGPIEELFLLALDTQRAGGTVTANLYPLRMDESGQQRLNTRAGTDARLKAFWKSLARIYRRFEATHRVPRVRVDHRTGLYRLATAR